jgi:hypothetical protein
VHIRAHFHVWLVSARDKCAYRFIYSCLRAISKGVVRSIKDIDGSIQDGTPMIWKLFNWRSISTRVTPLRLAFFVISAWSHPRLPF